MWHKGIEHVNSKEYLIFFYSDRKTMNKIVNEIETPKLAESTALETDSVIKLSGISKKYNLYNNRQDRLKEALHPRRKIYHRDFYALKDINLEVKRGEVLGIVGKNGSGKSTLLKVVSNILTPTAGAVEVKGKVVALLELGAGFNPEFTGIENIYFYCSLIGYNLQQTEEIVGEIIDFSELGDFVYQPLKTYSSGMRARLAFAVSVNVDPDILILDEVLAVGDELFRRKCYARMEEFFKGGKTMLFVSHDANSINQLCTRAILLDKGQCILEGPTKMVTMNYQKYLSAKKENITTVRQEIIDLDNNKELKMNYKKEIDIKDSDTKNKKSNNETVNKNISGYIVEEQNRHFKYTMKDEINNNFYIDGFEPKTTIRTGKDVQIEDYVILDKNGLKVNILEFGETYVLRFKATFLSDVLNVKFGAQIKQMNGTIISGANTKDYFGVDIYKIEKGKKFIIYYTFQCLLKNDTYYTNIFVDNRSETSEIFDANVFKVVLPSNFRFGGYVSLKQQITYTEIL